MDHLKWEAIQASCQEKRKQFSSVHLNLFPEQSQQTSFKILLFHIREPRDISFQLALFLEKEMGAPRKFLMP